MLQRVISRIFGRKLIVSQYGKTLQGNPSVLCFGKFPVANKFMDKKGGGGGSIKFSVENFLSHRAEKIS